MGQFFSESEPTLSEQFARLCAKGKLEEAKTMWQQNPQLHEVDVADQAFEKSILSGEFEVAQWIQNTLFPDRYVFVTREDSQTGITDVFFNVVHHMKIIPGFNIRFVQVDYNKSNIGMEEVTDNRRLVGTMIMRTKRTYNLPDKLTENN